MITFNASKDQYEKPRQSATKRMAPYAKTLIYFALGLLAVGFVGIGWPYLMYDMVGHDLNGFTTGMTASWIVSLILLFPLSLSLSWKAIRPKTKWMSVLYGAYAIDLGVMLASVIMSYSGLDPEHANMMVTMAFVIAGGCMLVMGVIGLFVKNIWRIGPFLVMALFSVFFLSLINLFVFNDAVYSTIYWIIDFVMLGVILLITALDFNRMKRLADAGFLGTDNNWAIYMASQMLTDFVWILVTMIRYLFVFGRSRD